MKYILAHDIALCGWRLVPHAYYVRGSEYAKGLSPDEFNILEKCDGETELSSSPLLESLLARGLCTIAEKGEAPTKWQRYRYCDNRYFPAVNWAVTGKCNFNCRHCFNATDNAPSNAEFSREEWKDLLRQLDECGVQNVTLTGGEPMLHPDFLEICREIEGRGMVVEAITTNGSFITSQLLDELNEFGCRPLFKLSLDGIGHHDWFRMRKGSEQEVIEKAELLRDKGFRFRFQTNVHKGNRDVILPTLKLAEAIGADGVRVIRTTESPRLEEMNKDLCLDIAEYYDFALELAKDYIAEKLKIDLDIWQVIRLWGNSKVYHHRPIEDGVHKYRDSIPVCKGARGQIAITPEGELLPCNQMSGYFKKHGIYMGNIKEKPLREFLCTGKYLNAVCMTVGELREKNPQCQVCPHWKLCMGGCRVLGIYFGGDYSSYDPIKCIYFNHYMEKFNALFNEGWKCVDDI